MLHAALLAATLFTTTFAGALREHPDPLVLLTRPYLLVSGLSFSLTLLAILAAHELGHYFVSRRHRVEVSLPYFIPAPSLIGTFGAFIRMKSPVTNKRALLDIGVAGPLAGVVVTIPVLLVGLAWSEQVPATGLAPPGLELGESILFKIIQYAVLGNPSGVHILLHPVALAGWLGLLVTSLNLIPVSQLDGGHIAYALLGERRYALVSRLVFVALVMFGAVGWHGWLVWAAVLFLMGFRHPSPLDFWTPLDPARRAVGMGAMALLLLTFTPVPFSGYVG